MKEHYTLKDVAKIFNVAPSALRYWDERGLIRFQRGENQYRIPGLQTLLGVSDVLFFRSMSVPLEDIARIPNMNGDELDDLLGTTCGSLQKKIEALEASMEQIRHKRSSLCLLAELKQASFQIEERAVPATTVLDFTDADMIHKYIYNPQLATIHYTNQIPAQYVYGFVGAGKEWIYHGDNEPKLYLKGLVRMRTEDENKNNLDEFYEAAQKMGYNGGKLTGFYLATLREDHQYDFYEGWLELLPENV